MKTIKINTEKVTGTLFVDAVPRHPDMVRIFNDTDEKPRKTVVINKHEYALIDLVIIRKKVKKKYSPLKHAYVDIPIAKQYWEYSDASSCPKLASKTRCANATIIDILVQAAAPQIAKLFDDPELQISAYLEWNKERLPKMKKQLQDNEETHKKKADNIKKLKADIAQTEKAIKSQKFDDLKKIEDVQSDRWY